MSDEKLCTDCRTFMLELLDSRIRRILEVGREESAFQGDEDDDNSDRGQSHCFHLMEISRILKGETTCGVYDDYGKPLTIAGPLFPVAEKVAG